MQYILEYGEFINELFAGMAGKFIAKRIINSPVRKLKADNKVAKAKMKQDYKNFKQKVS